MSYTYIDYDGHASIVNRLRAIGPHVGALRQVYVIGVKSEKKNQNQKFYFVRSFWFDKDKAVSTKNFTNQHFNSTNHTFNLFQQKKKTP